MPLPASSPGPEDHLRGGDGDDATEGLAAGAGWPISLVINGMDASTGIPSFPTQPTVPKTKILITATKNILRRLCRTLCLRRRANPRPSTRSSHTN
ncbi:hypothetical protein HWV62_33525 [Athelia sp. TMB]|nr:hypothetical protein HWV62_33525 [Athelia sp. TMB]